MLKKRNFFLMGIALLITLLLWAYYLYNKPHQSAAGEKAVQAITAESLYKEYQQDEHAADRRYLGKVIEVKGTIVTLSDTGGLEMCTLSAQNPAGGISCQMFTAVKNTDVHPKAGDTVIIKGKCTGFLMDVNLVDCIIK